MDGKTRQLKRIEPTLNLYVSQDIVRHHVAIDGHGAWAFHRRVDTDLRCAFGYLDYSSYDVEKYAILYSPGVTTDGV